MERKIRAPLGAALVIVLAGCARPLPANPDSQVAPTVSSTREAAVTSVVRPQESPASGPERSIVPPAANSIPAHWQATSPLADGYTGAGLVTLLDGRVLVAGGFPSGSQIPSAAVEIYDPAGSWTLAGSMNTPRANFSAVRLQGSEVLVAGGYGPDGHRTASSELYDPGANRWSATSPMVVARVNQATAMLADGRVLVVGGRIPTGPIASAEIFDPRSRSWSRIADMSTPRESPSATLLADGRVLVTGGRTADGAALNATESAELFDPSTGQWSAAAPMHIQRAYHTLTRMHDGRVLVTGGAANDSAMAEIYDPNANTWTNAGETPGDGNPVSRNSAAAILLPNGKVLIAGGYTSYPTTIQTSILFDPATTAWGLAGQTPGAHPDALAALLTDGRVLVVGGTTDADLYIPAH